MMKSGNLEFVCLLLTAIIINGIVAQKKPVFKPWLKFCDKLPDQCFKLAFEYWPQACNFTCSGPGSVKISECILWNGVLTDLPQCVDIHCSFKFETAEPTQTQQQEFLTQLDPDTSP